ncbi:MULTISPECIES: SRPBCC family protein [unclassified Nocardiopsis]|uniref:SRPBCC family protein n=1 Tax=Nocardiopsis TaxID=2013 RepID=UPI00387A91C6
MGPRPTGRLVATDTGRDLVLTRSFQAPIEDVWASITDPERTALWFASWTGDPAPGRTVRYRLTLEEGAPEGDLRIDACEPPHRLAVSSEDEYGSWHLEALLSADGATTILTFVQHLEPDTDLGSIGPGWEYYLDALAASREGNPPPAFDAYFPSQQAYYANL